MRSRIVFLFLFSLIFSFAKSQTPTAKPPPFFMAHIGGGASSLQGWSAFCSFSFERKNNEFTLKGLYNNQTGHKKADFIGYDYYNDRFGDVAFLYGRAFRKNIFFASVSAGPSFYKYTDRFLVKEYATNNWLGNDYVVNQKYSSGLSFAVELKLIALITEDVGIGVLAWCNINSSKPLAGASFSITFGRLRD